MQDFTLRTYKKLIQELLTSGYSFQTLQDFIQQSENKSAILRHDIDRKPENALVIATIEKEAGIKASYYFRLVKESYDEDIIKKISEMGHEIGYHYENLSEISRKIKDERRDIKEKHRDKLFELAIYDFERNLERLRKFCPIKTICMHGSPLSKWNNRDLWNRYNYRDFGIIAEPYFDIDFGEVFYLTDTGRRWDGDKVSVRDKVKGKEVGGWRAEVGRQRTEDREQRAEGLLVGSSSGYSFRSNSTGHKSRKGEVGNLLLRYTWDIIEAVKRGVLPDKIMLNIHPQRWDDRFGPWVKELIWQNVKNVVKRAFYIRG